MFEKQFDERVLEFVKSCNNNGVRMLLVGGSAVNFYGYQRGSTVLVSFFSFSFRKLRRQGIKINVFLTKQVCLNTQFIVSLCDGELEVGIKKANSLTVEYTLYLLSYQCRYSKLKYYN